MSAERRIALFIDFENLVTNTGISASHFDLQPALDRLLEKGKVVFRRAYCDWARFRDATRSLHESGVELIDVPPSTRAGKNSADIRLVIDALELCYAREHIDTFVIASGDSDFCPLAYKLRENNKVVIGLAIREATSPFFVKACDEFIYLKPDDRRSASSSGDEPAKEKDGGRSRGGRGGRGGRARRGGGGAGKATEPETTGVIPDVAAEVVHNLLGQATQPINPSLIKETIVRKEPDFDERDHGFSTFAKLLAAMERAGMLKRQQHGRQWYVVGPDAPTESAEHMPSAANAVETLSDMEIVEPEPMSSPSNDEPGDH
jgi:uncharacterized LabA/DUF88 family protein